MVLVYEGSGVVYVGGSQDSLHDLLLGVILLLVWFIVVLFEKEF